jgi:hypothetical protein
MVEYIDNSLKDVKVSDNARLIQKVQLGLLDCHSSLENLSYD